MPIIARAGTKGKALLSLLGITVASLVCRNGAKTKFRLPASSEEGVAARATTLRVAGPFSKYDVRELRRQDFPHDG